MSYQTYLSVTSPNWLANPKIAAVVILLTSSSIASQASQTTNSSFDLRGLEGDWLYLEDLTEGRELSQQGPPMSGKFSFKVADDAVILVSGHGSGHTNVRVALDGTLTEISGETDIARYSGSWKEGVFSYKTEYVTKATQAVRSVIKKEFRITKDGLVVTVMTGNSGPSGSIGLYKHPQDITMPTPAKATISQLDWLSGAWVGTRGTAGTTTIEERWSPSKGGSMLAVSRTVSRDKMSAFEFLRVVERDGGLVYIAQPNGGTPTEFVLSELGTKRAVFVNPRHDYPKRIVYEVTAEGGLTATIGLMKGGTPRKFEFKREGS